MFPLWLAVAAGAAAAAAAVPPVYSISVATAYAPVHRLRGLITAVLDDDPLLIFPLNVSGGRPTCEIMYLFEGELL